MPKTKPTTKTIFVAFDLGSTKWQVGFQGDQLGSKPKQHRIDANRLDLVVDLLEQTKRRLNAAQDVRVVSGYEAGFSGFWLHRWLDKRGVESHVIHPNAIRVPRRGGKRVKSDGIDTASLLSHLVRATEEGRERIGIHVPSEKEEDERRYSRALAQRKGVRTSLSNRIKGKLRSLGVPVPSGVVLDGLKDRLEDLRQPNGKKLGPAVRMVLELDIAELQRVQENIRELESRLAKPEGVLSPSSCKKISMLQSLKGIGVVGATELVLEILSWRKPKNRKQLAAIAGLDPVPHVSDQSEREQGISKAGNRRLRALMVQLAWCWVRYQPTSELTLWFEERFGKNRRSKRVGIVAVARKLLIALWRFAEKGVVPGGAMLKPATKSA